MCRLISLGLAPSSSGYIGAYRLGAPKAFDNTANGIQI